MVAVNGGILILGGFGLLELDEEEEDEDEEDEEEDEMEGGEEGGGETEMEMEQGTVAGAVAVEEVVVAMDGCALAPPPAAEAAAVSADATPPPSQEEDDDDDDDDESIAVAYLDDCWFVNLATAETAEIDPADAVAVAPGAAAPGPPPPALRGAKFLSTARGVLCFGGFDGERFYAEHSALDATRLRMAVWETSSASHAVDVDEAAGAPKAVPAAADEAAPK